MDGRSGRFGIRRTPFDRLRASGILWLRANGILRLGPNGVAGSDAGQEGMGV
jgi:hypothetical protein